MATMTHTSWEDPRLVRTRTRTSPPIIGGPMRARNLGVCDVIYFFPTLNGIYRRTSAYVNPDNL